MFRWIIHWSFQANFRWLVKVDQIKVQASYERCLHAHAFTPSRWNDSMLAEFLKGDANSIMDFIKRLCPFPQYHPDISKLVETYDEKKAPKGMERRMGWYTKDTCIEIHKLIISAITCYMNVLRIF